MRLAVCALSAVLLSGCSWLGMGGHSSSSYGSYGTNCGSAYGGGFSSVGYGAGGAGCGGAGGYGVGTGGANGYGVAGANGYGAGFGGANGYGAGYGAGFGGANGFGAAGANGYGAGYGGANGYGVNGAGGFGGVGAYGAGGGAGVGFAGAYNANALYGGGAAGLNGAYGSTGFGNSVTTLGANAPYGAAYGGTAAPGTVLGTQQYAGGFGTAGGSVTTVAGNPLYVQQPYPAYYGVPQLRAVGGGGFGFGGAMPFGIEAGIGTDFFVDGDIVGAKPGGPASGSSTISVTPTDAISYKDAFDNGVSYDLAATYDLNRDTTLIGRVGFSEAEGEALKVGEVHDGTGNEDLFAEFSDFEQVTLEGGIRKYVGGWHNPIGGFRPYVGATAGFTHTDDVVLSQYSSGTILPQGSNDQLYIDGGWSPTASGVVGAEWQVGGRSAIGVETGLRWTDNYDTLSKSDDILSVPVRLRGRVSF